MDFLLEKITDIFHSGVSVLVVEQNVKKLRIHKNMKPLEEAGDYIFPGVSLLEDRTEDIRDIFISSSTI